MYLHPGRYLRNESLFFHDGFRDQVVLRGHLLGVGSKRLSRKVDDVEVS